MADMITVEDLDRWLRLSAERLHAEAERLTELDSAIGDADHGTNMTRGFTAVVQKIDTAAATVQERLKSVGMTLVTTVGGASGSLYGTFFLDMGRNSPAEASMSAEQLAAAMRAGVAAVIARGHAQVGDKTMIDAFQPAIDTLSEKLDGGASLAESLQAASAAAAAGCESTKPLVARKGRASYLGDRSADHLDPGAASTAILWAALADAESAESA
ncbi:dihydroxyacetone kinase subunit DhaL [Microbacterium aquimaris]|uniref:Dihydroxyacetone kinase subunit DhaL n=1 Tax=Microbacterium aquimaris TaxID=459816 RepID=A0ABU5N7E8_9MICO|nr:dihydroxyacetone kinase subunit DhaL [Microbacterium aquimaris]MDZ8162005.1 dihydroxyacetone kinase subunit DhaL [Microbacterium aquimaris]